LGAHWAKRDSLNSGEKDWPREKTKKKGQVKREETHGGETAAAAGNQRITWITLFTQRKDKKKQRIQGRHTKMNAGRGTSAKRVLDVGRESVWGHLREQYEKNCRLHERKGRE